MEIALVHFEDSGWIALRETGAIIGKGASFTEAMNASLKAIGKAEADFDLVEEIGSFYRYAEADFEEENDSYRCYQE